MKYKLKRDLPWAKAGTVWEETFIGDIPEAHTMENDGMTFLFPSRTFSDWFEEVDERWKPSFDQTFFFLGADLKVESLNNIDVAVDRALYHVGNCFRTQELAEQAAEQIKALLKEFHKNNP